MEGKFYTVNQVAEILGMHHKTIRKFITQGKLGANKLGKQWRISEEDLNSFMKQDVNTSDEDIKEDEEIEFSTNEINLSIIRPKINVSTVIEINEIDMEQYMRISNTLIAIMNCKDPSIGKSTMNMKYSKEDNRLRVMLWGTMKFTEEMLNTISLFIESTNLY
ncbi:helix-turn-helix domain-containing protein [uncultured Tissierella sp.]|jgi:excisionase family DNA binding protein|uniref:helix-turn-helix domain-containing protein n=1 Tax=Tissierella sp. TaxID=41274 RepID=UPI0028041B13|nr:helix-turn-helix domain-containing protein [uncultured Tissierella sp.]MDU5081481.1 helix-turn-helix domain-containing protein [Bacillota bacterium]